MEVTPTQIKQQIEKLQEKLKIAEAKETQLETKWTSISKTEEISKGEKDKMITTTGIIIIIVIALIFAWAVYEGQKVKVK
jgi:hypothetical protein